MTRPTKHAEPESPASLNVSAAAFTPKIGRAEPTPLSPLDDSDPDAAGKTATSLKSRARRESLLKFKWPASLVSNIPFNNNKSLFNEEQKSLVKTLCQHGQTHLFNDWDGLGKRDKEKTAFAEQLVHLNTTYPGGILKYMETARKLLHDASQGLNPLDGWTPEVPTGVRLEPGSPEYAANEALGLQEIGKVGFVLVAGGLGERLGYSGIKIDLPCETTTGTTYLELYCKQIKAMQTRYCKDGNTLSLAIMVSDDTVHATQALLSSKDNFGLDITMMKQEKVCALSDSQATLSLESKYVLDSKPHGHGDVHVLMHSTGTAKKWQEKGIKWVAFFQDTNGLAFNTLPAVLGVSVDMDLEVNSVAVPRFAKQAVGALAKLKHVDGREMTVNVEYNQLDPLLRATINKDGDVNDPNTGKSIFPGNINQLVFQLDPYVVNLNKTNGVMAEFVNAKYTDDTKTTFKKPTRLECMMQDYPKVLDGESSKKVGFTQFPAWVCYSPCKNNTIDAAASVAKGVPGASAWTAESDQYACAAEMLRTIGCKVEKYAHEDFVSFNKIPAAPGPRIVIDPSTAIFLSEMREVFPKPSEVVISKNSTLTLTGKCTVEYLELNGAARFIASNGTHLKIAAVGNVGRVANEGHQLVPIKEAPTDITDISKEMIVLEVVKMRGFTVNKIEEKVVDTNEKHTIVQAYLPPVPDPIKDLDQDGNYIYYYTADQLVHGRVYEPPSFNVCHSLFGFC